MTRYIYVVGCVGVRSVKIGVATDCAARLSSLQTGCPFPLALLWSQAAPNALAAEKALHRRFSEQCVRGEWFNLGRDPVPLVKAALVAEADTLPAVDEEPEVILSPHQRVLRDVSALTGGQFAGREFIGGFALIDELRRVSEPLYDRSEAGLGRLIAEAVKLPIQQVAIDGRKTRGYYTEDLRKVLSRTMNTLDERR